MHLILTSDFPSTPIDEVAARLRAAASAPRVAWVPPHTDSSGQAFVEAQARFAAVGLDQLECVDIDEDRDEVQIAYLHEFDIVYLADGDAVRLRYNAIRSGLAGRLRQCLAAGRQVVGAGAGAMLLTPNVSVARLSAEPLADVLATRGRFDALGAVDYEVLPHADIASEERRAKVAEYSRHVEHDILCLADGTAIMSAPGTSPMAVGTLARFRNGHII